MEKLRENPEFKKQANTYVDDYIMDELNNVKSQNSILTQELAKEKDKNEKAMFMVKSLTKKVQGNNAFMDPMLDSKATQTDNK